LESSVLLARIWKFGEQGMTTILNGTRQMPTDYPLNIFNGMIPKPSKLYLNIGMFDAGDLKDSKIGPDDIGYTHKREYTTDQFNLRFRASSGQYTKGAYLKTVVHEYGHVHYKTFIFNTKGFKQTTFREISTFGNSANYWEHFWMKTNFIGLRNY